MTDFEVFQLISGVVCLFSFGLWPVGQILGIFILLRLFWKLTKKVYISRYGNYPDQKNKMTDFETFQLIASSCLLFSFGLWPVAQILGLIILIRLCWKLAKKGMM